VTLPPPKASENGALIAAVALHRDKEAFTRLFDFFAPRINAYLQQIGTERSIAEEITQDVMVTLWLKADLFDPSKAAAATWLYRIARNRRVDRQRRERLTFRDPADYVQDLVDTQSEGPETTADVQGRDDSVRRALQALPQDQHALVQMAFFDGLSHAQIAALTGVPLGTVKSRIRLAFARLRRLLERQGIAGAR
jgi:RNA polymerase sigma-70 factor (ECF subfamily)